MFLSFFSPHNWAKVYNLKIVLVRGSERMVAGDEEGDRAWLGLRKIMAGVASPVCARGCACRPKGWMGEEGVQREREPRARRGEAGLRATGGRTGPG